MPQNYDSDPYRRAQGDTESEIRDQLTADGDNVAISGFNEVEIKIEQPDGSLISDDTAGNVSVVDASAGIVQYEFASGDLSQAGRYRYEWIVEFGDGGIQSFPSAKLAEIIVREDVDTLTS